MSELLTAIRDLAAGGAPMSGVVARKVIQYFGQPGPAPELQTLAAREYEVLVALSQGEQYKEIAARLGISINSVRRHIVAIYEKLHMNSRLVPSTSSDRPDRDRAPRAVTPVTPWWLTSAVPGE